MRGVALAALLHLGALVRCASKSEWVYAHDPGDYGVHAAQEETWGGTCASGRHQSPIDVQTGLVADGGARGRRDEVLVRLQIELQLKQRAELRRAPAHRSNHCELITLNH